MRHTLQTLEYLEECVKHLEANNKWKDLTPVFLDISEIQFIIGLIDNWHKHHVAEFD